MFVLKRNHCLFLLEINIYHCIFSGIPEMNANNHAYTSKNDLSITTFSGSEQGQNMGQEPIRKIILQEALMLTVTTA